MPGAAVRPPRATGGGSFGTARRSDRTGCRSLSYAAYLVGLQQLATGRADIVPASHNVRRPARRDPSGSGSTTAGVDMRCDADTI